MCVLCPCFLCPPPPSQPPSATSVSPLPCCGLLQTRPSFISDPQPCSNRAEKHSFCPLSHLFFSFFLQRLPLSSWHAKDGWASCMLRWLYNACILFFFFFLFKESSKFSGDPTQLMLGRKKKDKNLHIIYKTSHSSSHPYLGVGISTWCHLCLRITNVRPTGRGGERGRRAQLPNSLQSLHEFPSALVWTPAAGVTLARPQRCWSLRTEALPDCCLHRFHSGGFLQKRRDLQEPNGYSLKNCAMNVPIHYLYFFSSYSFFGKSHRLFPMFHWHLLSALAGPAQASEGRQLCLPAQQPDEEQHFPADDSHTGPVKWR